jgi:hypothetical protein
VSEIDSESTVDRHPSDDVIFRAHESTDRDFDPSISIVVGAKSAVSGRRDATLVILDDVIARPLTSTVAQI